MTTLTRHTEDPKPTSQREVSPVVWGMDVRGLHDRRWATQRIQVVRRGMTTVEAPGPGLYLLVEPYDLLFFNVRPVIKRMIWLKPRVMRVRLAHYESDPYVEQVIADEDDRFLGIRRVYRGRTRDTAQALLTPDPRLARLWASQTGAREGRRAVLKAAGKERIGVTRQRATILNARDERHVDECVRRLLENWKRPGVVLDGVYEYQPGVWAHESAQIDSGARLIAPLWIGANQRVESGQIVIGPRVAPDAPGPAPHVESPAWYLLEHQPWRVTRRLRGRRVTKRLFDIAFSAGVLLALAPLFPLIILAIYLEDGWPPFFAHTRQTLRGREFPCYKFRTMCRNAEQMKAELAAKNVCDGPQFYIENDPRLLKTGKILRKFQLDELPQFWNVLLGHMSVVGPRPSPDKENQFCPTWREARLSVRPGVTGLWQVRRTRAPETDFQEWIRYDLEYVQHQSWRLDLWIIVQTIKKVIGK